MFSEIAEPPLWALQTARILVSAAMLLCFVRIWRGPTIFDRIVALDLIAALIMAHMVLLVFASGFVSFLDAAGAIAVISFLATVAFARYLERRGSSE